MRPTHLPNPHKLRTLIVYGHRQTADALGELFAACGQEVMVAYEETSACALARTHRPEMVLVDLRLHTEEMDQRLRQQNSTLVAITETGGETALRSSNHGFAHYLVEPIDPSQVRALLKKLTIPG
jgi:CheY-like chemotaxis protein